MRVRRQTRCSVTLTLRPNSAWDGFTAGQFVRAGFEIGGVRRTRTYSRASSQHGSARQGLELIVTAHPRGLVSNHLYETARPGAIVHLAAAQGDLVLPDPRPDRLVLIRGGSGITPIMSMLRLPGDRPCRGAAGLPRRHRRHSTRMSCACPSWRWQRDMSPRARVRAGVLFRRVPRSDIGGS